MEETTTTLLEEECDSLIGCRPAEPPPTEPPEPLPPTTTIPPTTTTPPTAPTSSLPANYCILPDGTIITPFDYIDDGPGLTATGNLRCGPHVPLPADPPPTTQPPREPVSDAPVATVPVPTAVNTGDGTFPTEPYVVGYEAVGLLTASLIALGLAFRWGRR